ncbi:MAG: elongation factor G [Bacteroidales bacterium]|jgi:elongation factor G|nr:elongation factor G [Bacteroidales bacterium]MCK9498512.1 elongation factor G [Bacteroidales bacterium]MDY0315478.1 elongation factor G [Bacteroidales bacterium]NLB86696.1 elongation factor G [Bacteroidales bacterium]
MKNYQTEQIRNIALVGNSGSGKTILAESMSQIGGVINRKGDIASKNTVSDYRLIEQENGNSLYSTVMYTEINNTKINILDNPGMDDFVGGLVSSLFPADIALMLINTSNGIEVGTEIHARYVEKTNKPMIIAMNHLDHEKTNFEKVFESIQETFGGNAVLAQFPVNAGVGFNAIIDVITNKMYSLKGTDIEISEIPAEHADQAEEIKTQLIEKAAEADESLMELFFENDTLTEEEMMRGIAAGLPQRGIFPIFCINARNDLGVKRLMEFIANVSPSPEKLESPVNKEGNEIKCDANDKPSLFVFKTSVEEHIGEVCYFKVLSGTLTESIDMYNTKTNTKERLSTLFVNSGKNRVKVDKMFAGDIGATVKLKGTKTGSTLVAHGQDWEMPAINWPNPKYRVAIKAVNDGDDEKLGEALNRLKDDDQTILVEYSKELKQLIVQGQGEYHLNILKWHLDNQFKIPTEFLKPRIQYRETITKIAFADYRHKKQSGGAGQFGEVHMIIEPYTEGMADPTMYKIDGKEYKISVRAKDEYNLDWGGKLVYYNCIVGGSIDARFLPAILKGIMEKIEEGPLTGSYARDIRVCIVDGKMHPVDSNEISFKLAGRNAFSNAFKKAGAKIMEPIYNLEVLVPGDRMGDVMSDLQGRRAVVMGMSSEKGFEKIMARVPYAEMGNYSTALRSNTGGRAMYEMSFHEYQQVPPDVQDQLLKAYEAEDDDE